MNNIDPKMNPITTLVGVVFLVIGLGTILMPIYTQPLNDIDVWFKIGFIAIGLAFLFSPETLIDSLKKFISRKSEEL